MIRKMKAYTSYSDWKKDQSLANQKLIGVLERLIKKTAPQYTTTVKWGQGCWVDDAVPKIYIHTEDDHVQLGFYRGSSLRDPKRILKGRGKYVRHLRVEKQKDIDEAVFSSFIEQVRK